MALKMLSTCSRRWKSAKFDLFCDWPLDSILLRKDNLPTLERLDIGAPIVPKHVRDIFEVAPRLTHAYVRPWAKNYGWILSWTKLTELILGGFIIRNGSVLNLLPMLHNIRELRLRFHYDEVDFEGGSPQFTPTRLNQLRVLEVPHPIVLSWFEAPSLSELCFTDHQQYSDEPLNVHGQISSLIQRSHCRIRKLSFETGRKFYVGTLKDVEELVIDYTHSDGFRSSIDISLPKLRLVTLIFSIDEDFESSMDSLATVLTSARVPTRSEHSSGAHVSLLECVTVELHYDKERPEIPNTLVKIANNWPVVVFRTHHS